MSMSMHLSPGVIRCWSPIKLGKHIDFLCALAALYQAVRIISKFNEDNNPVGADLSSIILRCTKLERIFVIALLHFPVFESNSMTLPWALSSLHSQKMAI